LAGAGADPDDDDDEEEEEEEDLVGLAARDMVDWFLRTETEERESELADEVVSLLVTVENVSAPRAQKKKNSFFFFSRSPHATRPVKQFFSYGPATRRHAPSPPVGPLRPWGCYARWPMRVQPLMTCASANRPLTASSTAVA
jgi:hypothetical protein